jgi:MFS family permease
MLVRVTSPLAAANVMNQSARTVMAIVGPVLAVELGLSASELGMLAACLLAAYAATQLPLGVALDAFGARRVQAVLMVLAAIGFATFALSRGFARLAAAVIKAHADWFERGRVAVVTGIATAIGALGSTLTTSSAQAMPMTYLLDPECRHQGAHVGNRISSELAAGTTRRSVRSCLACRRRIFPRVGRMRRE